MSKKNGNGEIVYPSGVNGVKLPHFFDRFDRPATNQKLFWAGLDMDGKPASCLPPLKPQDWPDALAFTGRKARNKFVATYVADWPNMTEDDIEWYDTHMVEHLLAACQAVYRA